MGRVTGRIGLLLGGADFRSRPPYNLCNRLFQGIIPKRTERRNLALVQPGPEPIKFRR